MTSRGEPAILSATPNLKTVPRFEKFELAVDVSASYDNPFDPGQIDLRAEFVSPAGKRTVIPGFFYQAYRNRREADDKQRPLLDGVGKPCWKVRFAPTETGTYTYTLTLRNRFGEIDISLGGPEPTLH